MNSLSLAMAIRRNPLSRWISDVEARREFRRWQRDPASIGGAVPALVKRRALLAAFAGSPCTAFVETGTFLGDTTYQFASRGIQTISIEVAPVLADGARRRFARYPNVRILQGDSGEMLVDVVPKLTGPALFWLDGHFSGGPTGMGALETPVVAEVATIIQHAKPGSVVYVDDARCFGTLPDYPPLDEFLASLSKRGTSTPTVEHDSIRFTIG